MIDSTIGKYKILRLIGEGGMASVYEAEHEMLGTKVAIKILNPLLSSNHQIKERFRNEARLMASLDHPNITRVIDFDEQPQQLSILMEYLGGENLNQRIKRNGPLSVSEVEEVFSQTLKACQFAHDKGVVHRDIKPSNIFILPNGQVKILDFGIAKLVRQGNEMTQTGTQLGTPVYMSPEQVKAEKTIDHRSDIYSLGVTLFFAINGKPPYDSATDSQFHIFNKIVFEPLPETNLQNPFRGIIEKACQKNREDRFQTCEEWLRPMSSVSKEKSSHVEKVNELKEEKKAGNDGGKIDITILSQPKINIYKTVNIGNQIWMAENLDVSVFRNGDLIPEVRTEEEWKNSGKSKSPAWCHYNNDASNGIRFGKLYNWYAVNDPRGLAPIGWHVPSDADWIRLEEQLGGTPSAGGRMKSVSDLWKKPNIGATNESGFSALPGGNRNGDGGFYYFDGDGAWWSSTEHSFSNAWVHFLYHYSAGVFRYGIIKTFGFSVRCLKD